MILWPLLRDHVLELTPEKVARLENVILKETLSNQQFMRQLEGSLKEGLKGSYKG